MRHLSGFKIFLCEVRDEVAYDLLKMAFLCCASAMPYLVDGLLLCPYSEGVILFWRGLTLFSGI